VEVIDLPGDQEQLYFWCLEDWSEEMKEAGNRKALWYRKMRDRGLRVKVAVDDAGRTGGMIHYLPIEHSPAEGEGLYFILCIWVHGYKQGRGNFQGKGLGRALLEAAERDARERGARGMAAWGLVLPFWMKASWFRKRGYVKADRNGMAALVWKPFDFAQGLELVERPFADGATPPKWIRERKRPEPVPGKVAVASFANGWCPAMNLVNERARRAAAELGDGVAFQEVDTSDRAALLEWGISDALFVDGKPVRTGPPPAYEKLRQLLAKKVRKLR